MGNRNSVRRRANNTDEDDSNQPCTLTSQQANTLQRLFSRGLNPDVALLPSQMKRMKVDAPPKTKQNRKTIRMKNISYLNKKTFGLKHILDNKYVISFEYSTTKNVYCSIYLFCNEITDKYNCTQSYDIKYRRPILDYLPNYNRSKSSTNIISKEDEKLEEEKQDIDQVFNKQNEHPSYSGTTYLLPKGFNMTFEQNGKDYMDLNAINYNYFQINPTFQYYPIIVVFSTERPKDCLLCIQYAQNPSNSNIITPSQNINEKRFDNLSKEEQEKIISEQKKSNIKYIQSWTSYGKLFLKNDNLYQTEIVSQKTTVNNRAFKSQEIYGLDRASDPYSKEENRCVICMTMPKDTILCPCRHLCLCNYCAIQLLKRSNKCPVCRAYVSEYVNIPHHSKQVKGNSNNPLL